MITRHQSLWLSRQSGVCKQKIKLKNTSLSWNLIQEESMQHKDLKDKMQEQSLLIRDESSNFKNVLDLKILKCWSYQSWGLISRQVIKVWLFLMKEVYLHIRCCCVQLLSRVRLFATPWTVAHQAPLPMGILQARTLEWVDMPSHVCVCVCVCVCDIYFHIHIYTNRASLVARMVKNQPAMQETWISSLG